MIDREKVLAGLESCADRTGALCRTCPYDFIHNENCMGDMAQDALELLKEQEPIKPTYEDFLGNRVARCGKCNGYIVRYKYCPGCGQAVKWE